MTILYHNNGEVYGEVEEVDGKTLVTVYTNKRLLRGDVAFRWVNEKGLPLEIIRETLNKYDADVELLTYTLSGIQHILKSKGFKFEQ